jgi:hypothetical protein
MVHIVTARPQRVKFSAYNINNSLPYNDFYSACDGINCKFAGVPGRTVHFSLSMSKNGPLHIHTITALAVSDMQRHVKYSRRHFWSVIPLSLLVTEVSLMEDEN